MRKKLNNPSPWISASDVNKYTYCPYQWYYERKYGQREIARLAKENKQRRKKPKKPQYSKKSAAQSNFARGRAFHKRHYEEMLATRQKIKTAAIAALFVVIISLVIFFIVRRLVVWNII